MNERRQPQGHPDVSLRNVLLFVVLISSVLAQTHQQQPQQDTRQSWIQVPLYPTNSVYELRHGAATTSGNGADHSSLLLLDENNVRDPSKAKVISHEENEEEYVDEEYEGDLESEQDPRSSRVLQEYEADDHNQEKRPLNQTAHLHPINNKNSQKNNSTQQTNHRVDPTSTQYDSYYYYDDYENDTHSAAEANVDYPDPSVISNEKKLQLPEVGEGKSEEDSAKEDVESVSVEIKSTPSKNVSKLLKEETFSETKSKSTEFSLTSSKSSKSSSELRQPSELKPANNSNSSKVLKSLETQEEDKNYEDSEQSETDSETPEDGSSMEASEESFAEASPQEESSSRSILIGEAVVSVVTTKSVVNGTISVPVTSSPLTTEQISAPPTSPSSKQSSFQIRTSSSEAPEDLSQVTTEDSSRILASVQTSRSISGARFLPFPVIDRVEQLDQNNEEVTSKKISSSESTESIIDKLDRVQSELSNGFLAGGFRTAGNTLQVDGPPEGDRSSQKRYTTTIKPPGKFVPRRYSDRRTSTTSTTTTAATTVTTTTQKSTTEKGSTKRFRLQTTLDDLEGLLPKNYPRSSLRRQFAKSTTASTPVATEATTTRTTSTTTAKSAVIIEDISAFLPPEDAAEVTEKSLLTEILAKSKVNITAFLLPSFNLSSESLQPSTSSTEKAPEISKTNAAIPPLLQDLFVKSEVDVSSFLPKNFKQKKNSTETQDTQQTADRKPFQQKSRNSTGTNSDIPADKLVDDLIAKSEVDLSAFLPKDFNLKNANNKITQEVGTKIEILKVTPSPVTPKSAGIKLVFPSRPGGRKPSAKITTPPPRGGGEGAFAAAPKIQKGWPTRATTEFTGWPTSSTTPISIEKLLEAARTATASSFNASAFPTTSTVTTTSTTTTTTTTPRPTTPGMCEDECEVAGTIRIIDNATWVPELLDRNTREWQDLANKVEREMNTIFSKSAVFRKWFQNVRIDAFSQGSILVDYFVELNNLHESVNTQQLKVIFHDSLRTHNNNRWNETKTKGPLKMGDFTIDPKFTDFVVIPKATTPALTGNEDRLIPQWAIAVIVIGIGGLLFIIVFGVSVLANRQSVAKLKPSMMAMYDEETTKNVIHATHAPPVQRSSDYPKADIHTMWNDPSSAWNDKSYDKSFESNSNKVLMDGSMHEGKKYNMYDSWRSEWNGYYYNPSHTSSKYGGYDSTSNLSRHHHPDYDTNF
ncbi:flocculation protein FLO11 isoform X2 [Belonocnema kinseyi]|uniref:flocculation protein FLO11 isoform X2 n=1 Tax=Belonocnema kinseyi TaxID=2817044 RepID=UPI00143CD5AA|nr:flocculation protein FLO11 isoform X2 [Belonocnema kinseyi]